MISLQKKQVGFNVFYIILILILVFFIGLFTTMFFLPEKQLTSLDIYNRSFNSVVELRAFNNDDEESFGSAVCVSKNGEFLTNAHVISYKEKNEQGQDEVFTFSSFAIRFPDSDDFENASLVKYDIENDLALIKLNKVKRDLNVLKISENYKTGENCYAVGNLQNYGVSITQGIISKKSVRIENNGDIINAIQCDLNITEGNSGGALLNKNGELIGLTTFRTKDLSGKIIYGISFSIPASKLIKFINMGIN